MNMITLTRTVLCLALAAGSLQSIAAGIDDTELVSTRFSYADLAINTPAGAAALYHRIQVAAGKICSGERAADLRYSATVHACWKEAVAKAVQQVKSAPLSALHASKQTRGRQG
jgi:UrcA family protein